MGILVSLGAAKNSTRAVNEKVGEWPSAPEDGRASAFAYIGRTQEYATE